MEISGKEAAPMRIRKFKITIYAMPKVDFSAVCF